MQENLDENIFNPVYMVPSGMDPKVIVDELNAQEKSLRKWRKRAQKYCKKWEEQNPIPVFDQSKCKPVPKWKGLRKSEITSDMRSERDVALHHNQNLLDLFGEKRNKWYDLRLEAMENWIHMQEAVPVKLTEDQESWWWTNRTTYRFFTQEIAIWEQTIPQKEISDAKS